MDQFLSTDVDYLADRLSPLFREGKPVTLALLTPDSRRKEHLMVLTPGTLLGWSRERILVSVVGQGSAVVSLATKREYNRYLRSGIDFQPRISECVRAGIPARAAAVMVAILQKLYLSTKEKPHAHPTPRTSTSSTGSTSRPRPRRYTQFRE